jgi:hypothetical protein
MFKTVEANYSDRLNVLIEKNNFFYRDSLEFWILNIRICLGFRV